ncbi:MAG: asparagine synthase (glutamine-hydrolyzing) [Victivallales bacterium]|nr:asparagine synthase (glutamine-hydrolyzing) [Victivallales bacterium]
MCGIAGIINFNAVPVDGEILKRMNLAQIHRGPDEEGFLVTPRVGLAHRRLSVIDLRNGRQPIANEDGTIHIIFNGEIYNCSELRHELTAKGHLFTTETDTEVMVHLYEECGRRMVERLNGMFAVAIYDSRRRTVLLARDRMGQKPLLYFRTASALVFASEMSALRQHPEMPRDLNLQGIYDYFSLQYIPAPETVFTGVFKLPPAHTMEIDAATGHIDIVRYWTLDFADKTELDFPAARDRLRELMFDAVRKRLIADVPYGAFLSGGLDSTIIAGIMSEVCDQPVKTFTIGFNEKNYDERNYARLAVAHLNRLGGKPLIHHERIVSPGDFDMLVRLVRHYGEPYSDASMLPTCLLSRFAREHVVVAMSGDGADELFAGYNRYLLMRMMHVADMFPLPLRRAAAALAGKLLPSMRDERTRVGKLHRLLRIAAAAPANRYLAIINRFDEALKQQLCGDIFHERRLTTTQEFMDAMLSAVTATNGIDRIMELDIMTYLNGDILNKVDIASMANSLEVRSPFMDYRVVEFAAALPLDFKQHFNRRKHIVHEAFQRFLPPELATRSKAGFGVPLAQWFRDRWYAVASERLLEGQAVRAGFLQRRAVENLLREHRKGKADHSYPLFSLLVLELFLEECC